MSLIVIDGLDGCGKSTQLNRLKDIYSDGKTTFISFPDYEMECSVPVRLYLGGKISPDPDEINAYAASSFYAVDRYISFKQVWEKDVKAGKNIIAGRYVSSNAIHQMCKLPESVWDDFLDWLDDYEYNKLGLPRPDKVIFLDMPIEISQKMLMRRYGGDAGERDIHERDTAYLERCRISALYAAKRLSWDVVGCADTDAGEPLPPERITDMLTELVGEVFNA